MSIIYRAPVSDAEIEMAAEVESLCLSTAWSKSQIANLSEYACYYCAIEDGLVCGIASMYTLAGEGQIMNIAVLPTHRRRRIGHGLMAVLVKEAQSKNCEIITLEVAEDNYSAISLYEAYGFSVAGRRNGFYKGKNALIMEKKL